MRNTGLGTLAISAILLSGCSWMGHDKATSDGYGVPAGPYGQASYAQAGHGQALQGGHFDPCQIAHPSQPIPAGCDPAMVTVGTGFSQNPDFGGGYGLNAAPTYGAQFADGAYGDHTDVADVAQGNAAPRPRLRKPRLRGALSLGVEKSIGGDLLDFGKVDFGPVGDYNPQDFNQGSVTADGREVTTFTANAQRDVLIETGTDIFTPNQFERVNAPNISFDDVWSTPLRVAGGLEYIATPKTTVFGNVGYSYAEGKSGQVASVDATLYRRVENFDDNGVFVAANTTFVPNQQIATFSYDFSDMRRLDLEGGLRHYFGSRDKPGYKRVTPFVGVSGGASFYNDVSFTSRQLQSSYGPSFEIASDDPTADPQTFQVASAGGGASQELYDSQWVPSGQINVGAEWQMTPKTAIALETGIRVEGSRDLNGPILGVNDDGDTIFGEDIGGDTFVSIPVTIRGSFNF